MPDLDLIKQGEQVVPRLRPRRAPPSSPLLTRRLMSGQTRERNYPGAADVRR
jgi:hypothetical protein